MDTETSSGFKEVFQDSDINHRLVPQHNHQSNNLERAIQISKHHFKAGLVPVDPCFPVNQ